MAKTVLICDDAIFMRTMISDILTQAGYQVVGEAESGIQAIELYRELKPDLVTMDIVMPDMGGIEAVRAICKEFPEARILMCSAMGQQGLVVEASVEKGRSAKPKLKIGICGEHGGDPQSIAFCHEVGLDYVSCSPFRVPVARLAAAQAALKQTETRDK